MLPGVEILVTVVSLIAGISGAAWNIYQLYDAHTKRVAAATVIQRAYRKHRALRFKYGRFELEHETVQEPLPEKPRREASEEVSTEQPLISTEQKSWWFTR